MCIISIRQTQGHVMQSTTGLATRTWTCGVSRIALKGTVHPMVVNAAANQQQPPSRQQRHTDQQLHQPLPGLQPDRQLDQQPSPQQPGELQL